MNWGKATVLILIAFVLFIGGMSVYMFRSPKDDYDHQYYEDGINFDHDYNREAQVTKDHAEPVIKINADSILVTFSQIVEGKVKLMRPSSDAADKSYLLEGKVVTIPLSQLIKGKWKLVFEWKSNNKAYLYNTEIFVK
ncbi:FixH family protein [Mucilaginibacter sp. OK098]|uniref:FixH family protein n=1 Tax=Mucilaginibacter sp. OK098 TaxID=1855297 RepID=UPI00091B08DC|nr:FixH family protein [Mucilaginibacter sp. OK098]SHN14137.1 FixH protein [Mucilaginibacter sp. OK098]